jgi:KDO2-lipid IV(A) lauroyltransferase
MTARPDVRLGQRWTPMQRVKNDLFWVLACAALAATRPLSPRVLRALGRALGVTAHAFATRARRTALGNVAATMPELDRASRAALVRRCFATLGELLGETVSMLHPFGSLPVLPLTPEARAVLDEARAEGRGVVFASAHLGPWERVAASLVAAGQPLVALARESYDPRFTRLYERLRERHGVRFVWRSSPGAALRIVRALRAGGVLGFPMDLRARVAACDVPLLGVPARTALGPARIALRARAPVVVGTAAPGPGSSLVVTATRIPTEDLAGGARGADAPLELTRRINAELSRRIRALPEAWPWMHPRWDLADLAATSV